jgi:hypothetical protein
VNQFSLIWLLPETSPDFSGHDLLTTGIEKAFAAFGYVAKEVHPKSNIHLKGKYLPSC